MFSFLTDVIFSNDFHQFLVGNKKENWALSLYEHISCILVLWPWQVRCLALKQKQGVTPAIISVVCLKSLRSATSHLSRPTQAYQAVTGLTNTLNMSSIGFSRNDFPQFVGQTIRIFVSFCVLFKKTFLRAQENEKTLLFCFAVPLFHILAILLDSWLYTRQQHD